MLAADDIIAIATVVVAIVALGVALWEGKISRRHNRLSVMPLLTIRHHLGGSQRFLGLSVANDGLGPALITACTLEVDGRVIQDPDYDAWEAAVSSLGLHHISPRVRTFGRKEVIRSGDAVWLLSAAITDDHAAALDAALRRVNVRVAYESIHGDKRESIYRD